MLKLVNIFYKNGQEVFNIHTVFVLLCLSKKTEHKTYATFLHNSYLCIIIICCNTLGTRKALREVRPLSSNVEESYKKKLLDQLYVGSSNTRLQGYIPLVAL